MAGWRTHEGTALALPIENIDTDQLISARFMSVPRVQGYGPYLLHDLRHDAAGTPDPDNPLNRHPGASVLVTRRNFGCGSSREAALYALVDAGFCAVIAPSFGDIFAGNAVNNGLLPARIGEAEANALLAALVSGPAAITIDLDTCTLVCGTCSLSFDLAETARTKLINGWDDIDLTRADAGRIAAFRQRHLRDAPWAWPRIPE